MKTHTEMITEWKQDPAFREAYNALEEEFTLFDELFQARSRAGLTQTQVADRMGTKTPAVARLEAGGGKKNHSPSLVTLRKYAEAVGCRLEIKLVPLVPLLGKEEGSSHTRKKRSRKIGVAATGSVARVSSLTAPSGQSRTRAS